MDEMRLVTRRTTVFLASCNLPDNSQMSGDERTASSRSADEEILSASDWTKSSSPSVQ